MDVVEKELFARRRDLLSKLGSVEVGAANQASQRALSSAATFASLRR
jgi:hypothetical protein